MSDIGTPYMPLEDVIELLKKRDAEIERQRAVIEVAREVCVRWDTRGLGNPMPGESPTDSDCLNALSDAVKALDGGGDG